MDVETSAAIERVSDRIDSLEHSVRGDMAQLRVDLRTEFREGLAENRRHTQVLFEMLRDDIRILAEGFATVSTKLDSLQRQSPPPNRPRRRSGWSHAVFFAS